LACVSIFRDPVARTVLQANALIETPMPDRVIRPVTVGPV